MLVPLSTVELAEKSDAPGIRSGRRAVGEHVVVGEWSLELAAWTDRHLHEELNHVVEGELHVTYDDETYVAVVAPSLGRVPTAPEDIQGLTLLDTAPELPLFRYLADAVGRGEPWQFAKVEHLGTIAAIRRRARMGLGFAVLPEAFVAQDLARGTLVRAFADVSLPSDVFRLLWMRGDPRTPVFDQLARDLRSLPLVYDER